jgi:hypothetical protein
MHESLQQETEKLVRSWMRHEQTMLRDYLVADVEDPRINVQSLISRQFLITAACGERFKELMDQELRFAVAMNWLLGLMKRISSAEELAAVLHGLRHGAGDAEGIELPACIARIFRTLPAAANGVQVPNYLEDFLAAAPLENGRPRLAERNLNLFLDLWREALAAEPRAPVAPTVLEAACGSANDYRCLEAGGLSRLIDYTGMDLCEKNVENARVMFPQARFQVGNVFELPAPDKSVDYLFAHDLFEHLSLEGLEQTVREVCRVTRRALCLGFFNMDEIAAHVARPVDDYHWNTLSVDRVRESFAAHGFGAQVVHIGSFLRWATGCDQTHNEQAYTFLLRAAATV